MKKILLSFALIRSDDKALSLRQNFSWTFLSQLVYGTCQWGTLIVLAKLGTPQMLGQFTLALALLSPVILFFNLNLRGLQASDTKQEYFFYDYLLLRIITTTLALCVVVSLVFLGDYQRVTAIIIVFVGLAKAIESISDIFYGLFQQKERMDNIAQSIIFRSLLSFITLSLTLYLTNSLKWAVIGWTITTIITLFVFDIPTSNVFANVNFKQQLSQIYQQTLEEYNISLLYNKWQKLLNLINFSLPVGGIMMLLAISTNMPRYCIEYYLGQRELGIFAAIAYIPTSGIIVVSALGQSALTRLAKYYTKGDKIAYIKLIFQLIFIGVGLGLFGILIAIFAGKPILTLVYQSEYAEKSDVLLLLMFWVFFSYIGTFLGYAITAARVFRSTLIVVFIKACTTALFSLSLIPSHGLNGSAYVLVIDEILQIIGFAIIFIYALKKLPKLNENTFFDT